MWTKNRAKIEAKRRGCIRRQLLAVAPSLAREGRWKRHFAEQVQVIEHVTLAPDAVHAASAPVVGCLVPDLESSSSSAAHAAATSNDDINEKLTSIINMFDSYREKFSQFECGSSSSTAAHAAPVQAPSKLRGSTQFAPLLGALQDTAWPLVRHA